MEKAKVIDLADEVIDPNEVLFNDNVVVNVPAPEAKTFNNLAEYYSKTFGKKNEEKFEQNINERLNTASTSMERFANFKLKQNDETEVPRMKRRTKSNLCIFDKMNQSTGPLSILYRSMGKQLKIFVRRRKICSSKEERFSWLTAHLVAFDRHLNLALQDVVETFSHQLNSKHSVMIQKRTRQMLIRGDNVVLVTIPSE
ncbi:hypothetical protein RDWZM_008742 [Blomia tropicalis]|uniref:Sm domain-containing protein n=1 Tax=Blomia tropicalis TaxID=40697 RepID=A0A9Q0RKM8_BLOTA|nr:LSM domain [Blomia tropicalis]KAJ6217585.1 hypothetical protein RDWZM_008742 [Blomia tropicalis]